MCKAQFFMTVGQEYTRTPHLIPEMKSKVVPVHTMKAYGEGVEIQLHSFLRSDGDHWST
jgi:hypothetical protein